MALRFEVDPKIRTGRFEVHPDQIHTWQRMLAEGAPELFSPGQGQPNKANEELVARLYQQIGQLTVERDFLSKRSSP